MQEVSLPELLIRKRGDRSLREMARRCNLPVTTVQRAEAGRVDIPSRPTLEAISVGYEIDMDTLALATYGRYFEEVTLNIAPAASGPPALVLA